MVIIIEETTKSDLILVLEFLKIRIEIPRKNEKSSEK